MCAEVQESKEVQRVRGSECEAERHAGRGSDAVLPAAADGHADAAARRDDKDATRRALDARCRDDIRRRLSMRVFAAFDDDCCSKMRARRC